MESHTNLHVIRISGKAVIRLAVVVVTVVVIVVHVGFYNWVLVSLLLFLFFVAILAFVSRTQIRLPRRGGHGGAVLVCGDGDVCQH